MVSSARLFGNDSAGSHRSESLGSGEHSLLQRSVRLPLAFDVGALGWTFYGSVGLRGRCNPSPTLGGQGDLTVRMAVVCHHRWLY